MLRDAAVTKPLTQGAAAATFAQVSTVGINPVVTHGAVGDGQDVRGAAITSGSAVVTASGAGFTTKAKVGQLAYFYGAGAAGALLATTIASVDSDTQVTLAATAGTTVASAGVFTFGTDNTTAMTNAINAAKAVGGPGAVVVPAGLYLMTGTLPAMTNARDVRIGGAGTTTMSYGTYVTPAIGRTEIRYMGSGAGTFLPVTNTKGFLLHDITIAYGNPGFTGDLVSTNTSWNPRFMRCSFRGAISGVGLTQAVLFFGAATVEGVWEDCIFERAKYAFRFQAYFNANTLSRCVFLALQSINAASQGGWGWGTTFNKCTFEPRGPESSPTADPFGTPSNLNLQGSRSASIIDCAWWDGGDASGEAWITLQGTFGTRISGGLWVAGSYSQERLIFLNGTNTGLTIEALHVESGAGAAKVFTYSGSQILRDYTMGAITINGSPTTLGFDEIPFTELTWASRPATGHSERAVVAASGAAQTLSATAEVNAITLTANCTITIPATIAYKKSSKRARILLTQDATGSWTVIWAGGTIKWAGGAAPTLSTVAGRTDEIVLETHDLGTTWFGRAVGTYY